MKDVSLQIAALSKYSHDAIASAFSEEYGDAWRNTHLRWIYWDGERWEFDSNRLLHHVLRKFCRELAQSAAKESDLTVAQRRQIITRLGSSGIVHSLATLLANDPFHHIEIRRSRDDPEPDEPADVRDSIYKFPRPPKKYRGGIPSC